MALEKVTTYSYEVKGEWKVINERQRIAVNEDGKELSYSFKRQAFFPHMDVSGESDEIKGMADALWTDAVKEAWYLHSNGYPTGDPSTDWELAQLQKYCDDNSVDYEDGNNLDEDGNAISANSKAELVELIEAE